MATDRKILITGATGLLGSNLTRTLLEAGHSIRVLTRHGANHPFFKGCEIEIVEGDLADPEALTHATGNISLIYHCGALISYLKKDRKSLWTTNVEGTRNLMQAALKNDVARVLHVSSVSAITPEGGYALSKYNSEKVCAEYIAQGLDIVIARPATIYGAGDIKGNSAYPFQKIAGGNTILVPPGGKSYVAVQDAVRGLILLMQKGITGSSYVFAAEDHTFHRIYEFIAHAEARNIKLIDLHPVCEYLALPLKVLAKYDAGVIELLFRKKYFSARATQDDLKWSPSQTIERAINDMWEFYKYHSTGA